MKLKNTLVISSIFFALTACSDGNDQQQKDTDLYKQKQALAVVENGCDQKAQSATPPTLFDTDEEREYRAKIKSHCTQDTTESLQDSNISAPHNLHVI